MPTQHPFSPSSSLSRRPSFLQAPRFALLAALALGILAGLTACGDGPSANDFREIVKAETSTIASMVPGAKLEAKNIKIEDIKPAENKGENVWQAKMSLTMSGTDIMGEKMEKDFNDTIYIHKTEDGWKSVR